MTAGSTLAGVSQAQRAAILAGPRDAATHARLLASLPFANALDQGSFPRSEPQASGEVHEARSRVSTQPPDPTFPRSEPKASGEVISWNLERCKYLDESAAFLAALDADVLLLSELDWGMARSGQRHAARELAARLGMSFAYGVEFLELDLGGARERTEFHGQTDAVGYHGNAILARGELARPLLVRLEARGDWFDGARGEARVGGRCAVLAQFPVEGRATTFAAVHLDSHGTKENRAAEMRVLLDAIDAYDCDAPVVIGGDLNAFSLGLAEIGNAERVAAALRDDPQRWSHPVPHEPLFAVAEARGFEWSSCNALGTATLRHATETGSTRGVMKLDWFLCRGIAASEPHVVDAIAATTGKMLSDHEAIAISLHA
jgi:endonuclease/exonuclease/phosphatase family metal-dependent hydrolase